MAVKTSDLDAMTVTRTASALPAHPVLIAVRRVLLLDPPPTSAVPLEE